MMAIKTLWAVEHECGDDEVHDLSAKRPSERAGYARWLRSKDCSACWLFALGRDVRPCVTSTVRTNRFPGEQEFATSFLLRLTTTT
jgi:hypothetical protein